MKANYQRKITKQKNEGKGEKHEGARNNSVNSDWNQVTRDGFNLQKNRCRKFPATLTLSRNSLGPAVSYRHKPRINIVDNQS
jgi:hypothetical protein